MARVLVVHHDLDQADIEVDRLRRAGHRSAMDRSAEVLVPVVVSRVGRSRADMLVYDAWISAMARRVLSTSCGPSIRQARNAAIGAPVLPPSRIAPAFSSFDPSLVVDLVRSWPFSAGSGSAAAPPCSTARPPWPGG